MEPMDKETVYSTGRADTVCTGKTQTVYNTRADYGTAPLPMTTEQLAEAESLYADNKFGQHPQEAARIAVAAREAATQTSDLKLINRFSKLAEHLERASHSA